MKKYGDGCNIPHANGRSLSKSAEEICETGELDDE